MSPDISTIPHLTPAAYPLHFGVPPLGPGAFAAPEESAIAPEIAATFQYIPPTATLSATPCTNTRHDRYGAVPAEYCGNTQDPAYGMELSDDRSIAALPRVDKGVHMELSDDEGQLA
ncbi:hypothetical protein DXG01_001945 [Tephrocybe rancida]|nr:hypothetical protein DXG01_001945 [Tephrocybe rancida]